jgi:hypothetical protein
VLADHDGVHTRGVVEREEGEASRAAGRVAHDRARVDLAELLKVCTEAVYEKDLVPYLRVGEQAF